MLLNCFLAEIWIHYLFRFGIFIPIKNLKNYVFFRLFEKIHFLAFNKGHYLADYQLYFLLSTNQRKCSGILLYEISISITVSINWSALVEWVFVILWEIWYGAADLLFLNEKSCYGIPCSVADLIAWRPWFLLVRTVTFMFSLFTHFTFHNKVRKVLF